MARGSGKAFAIVVLIVSIIVIAFVITELVYAIRLRNGVTLSATSLNVLLFLQVITLVLIILIMIWAIYQLARGTSAEDEIDDVDDVIDITRGDVGVEVETRCGKVVKGPAGGGRVYVYDDQEGCNAPRLLKQVGIDPTTVEIGRFEDEDGSRRYAPKPVPPPAPQPAYQVDFKTTVPVEMEATIPLQPVYPRQPAPGPFYQPTPFAQTQIQPQQVSAPVSTGVEYSIQASPPRMNGYPAAPYYQNGTQVNFAQQNGPGRPV
jgi:hypothetical protein